jgi:GntR family transcriptional regulator/MocR family aminotransferase
MPRNDELALALEPGVRPRTLAVARALTAAIRSGALVPGQRLPGSRALGARLGLTRNTVVAAYEALAAEGWLRMEGPKGTFVAPAELPPAPPAVQEGLREDPGYKIPPRRWRDRRPRPAAGPWTFPQPGVLSLSGGLPDLRLVPHELLARAYRRALRAEGRRLLGYLEPGGHPRLRAALAAHVRARRGIPAGPENVLVTHGAQMALYLVAQVLLQPGDRVGVERLGYPPAWDALGCAGAELVPVPVDAEGLDVARLETQGDLRAVYVTPHHQYPTMAVMSPARRLALLAWAARRRAVIVEDDYDNEVHYAGQPVLPLASMDGGRSVIYVGSLSKILAPGLRLGYLVAPAAVIEAMARLRLVVDRQGDQVLERAVADLFEEGVVVGHARRVRRAYLERRDALVEALRAELGDALTFEVPAGGMALWARAPGVDTEAWSQRAAAAGVHFMPGRSLDVQHRLQHRARLGFAALDPHELREAVRRLAACRPPS